MNLQHSDFYKDTWNSQKWNYVPLIVTHNQQSYEQVRKNTYTYIINDINGTQECVGNMQISYMQNAWSQQKWLIKQTATYGVNPNLSIRNPKKTPERQRNTQNRPLTHTDEILSRKWAPDTQKDTQG
jgi:hypothetical protein